jgi:hypothetical protein
MAKIVDNNGRPVKCSEKVWRGWDSSRCEKNATVMRHDPRLDLADPQNAPLGEQPYCGTHDPVRKTERRTARVQAQYDEAKRRHDRVEVRKTEFVNRMIALRDKGELETGARALVDDIYNSG